MAEDIVSQARSWEGMHWHGKCLGLALKETEESLVLNEAIPRVSTDKLLCMTYPCNLRGVATIFAGNAPQFIKFLLSLKLISVYRVLD